MVEQVKTKTEPYVRFRGFTDEWNKVKLGELGVFKTSSVNKVIEPNEIKVNLVNYMDVYNHKLISNETVSDLSITSAKPNQLETNNLLRGDILFTPSSETPEDIGHSMVMREDLENTLYSYHLLRFRPKQDIDLGFADYFCNIPPVRNQIVQKATGSTRFTVGLRDFSDILVKSPSLPEQQKIGELFQTLDNVIDLSNTQVENLKQQKKALLQRLLPQKGETEPKVRLRGFTDEWNEVKLGDLVKDGLIELSRGNVIPKGSDDGTYPVYSSSVTNKGLFTTIDDYMFDEELITWSIDGGGDFFYRPKHKFSVTNVSGVLQVLSEDVDINFLYAQLSVLHTRKTFDYLLKAHPSVIKTLYTLYIPSLEEQQAIGELFQTLDEQIRLAEDKVSQYKELKQALLQRLFV